MILFYAVNNNYSEDFMKWIINYMRDYFIYQADKNILKQFGEYIKRFYNLTDIDIFNICIISIEKLKIIHTTDEFKLIIDETLVYHGLKYTNITKLINDGNMDIQAYPIFTNIKEYIKQNIDNFYELYNMGIV